MNLKVRIGHRAAGPVLMLTAALLFTLFNLLIKQLGPHYTVWHIGFYRFLGGILVMGILFSHHGHHFRGVNRRLLIIRGCCGSVAFILLVSAIRLLPVSTAVVIFYVFPAFAALFSFLLYGERIRPAQLGCIAVVLAGVAILLDFRLTGSFWGQLMALGGGVIGGLTITLVRALRVKNGPVVIYFYFCAMGALVSLPMFVRAPVFPASALEWAMIGGIILLSVGGQLLMNEGFRYCLGWEGGVLMASEVVFTAACGILLLHDPAGWRFWLGGGTILGSVMLLNRLAAVPKSCKRPRMVTVR
jgi:drug/metabolite transporter (DMT)-like permease